MPRSILIRIHMSRIIVYLDRDLNIFQASRRATGQPGQGAPDPNFANWDGQSQELELQWQGEELNFRVSWRVSRWMSRWRRGQARCIQGIESRRRRLLNADVEICRFCRACADHQASLIVSAESLYSLFTRSLNDSSCWNYCRGKGTRCSHLLHMHCTLFCSHRVHTSRGNERSEWITEISECNLAPAETSKVEQILASAHEERD